MTYKLNWLFSHSVTQIYGHSIYVQKQGSREIPQWKRGKNRGHKTYPDQAKVFRFQSLHSIVLSGGPENHLYDPFFYMRKMTLTIEVHSNLEEHRQRLCCTPHRKTLTSVSLLPTRYPEPVSVIGSLQKPQGPRTTFGLYGRYEG